MSAKAPESGSPHSGHRSRLRARLAQDPLAVRDDEVLELLLGYGLVRKDTRPLAREMLRRFGSIRGALDARPDELLDLPGFGPGLMTLWQVVREVLARHAASAVRQREELASPEAVAHMAKMRLAACPHEECWLALVDARNRLIAWKRLQRGGVDAVYVQPGDVLAQALTHKASGIILVHNHPGGSLGPSRADILVTRRLRELAPQMGLRFLDHVIITEEDCFSIVANRTI